MSPELRRAAAHVFVHNLDDPGLDDGDRHHLSRVLRLRAGEVVTVGDGRGSWFAGRWTGRDVEPDGPAHREPPPRGALVGCAFVKGDRPALIVQKLTEIGVAEIAFFASSRSVVRWSAESVPGQLERLRRVAREAAMQSRRTWLPSVTVEAFDHLAGRPGACLAEPGGTAGLAAASGVLIGPEGGFTDDELAACRDHVELGPNVLRAETAAIVAGVLLTKS